METRETRTRDRKDKLENRKLKLNKFKKQSRNVSKNKPKEPKSAFHLYCQKVKEMGQEERIGLFGDLDLLTKVEQVRKIKQVWEEMDNVAPLKQNCMQEFQENLSQYHSAKKLYKEKLNEILESNTVYVGNLADSATETGLKELFEAVGRVESVRIKQFRGNSKRPRFGFCEFIRAPDALKAVDCLNGTIYLENELIVKLTMND
jgi:hypothetical protein